MKNIWLLVLFVLASCAADGAREEAKAAAASAVDSWSGAKLTDLIGVWGWPNGGIEEATADAGGMALWYEPASRISCADKYPVVEIYRATCQNRRPNDNRPCYDPYTDANATARAECEAQRLQTGQFDFGCVIAVKFNQDLTITQIDPPRSCSTEFYERLIDRDRRWTMNAPQEAPSAQ